MDYDGGKPPKRGSGYFITVKLGGLALLVFISLLAVSSFINKEYVPMWFDLVKLTLGYLFGTISTQVVAKH
jgi:hypothetical protein